jgi:hypothetical protein
MAQIPHKRLFYLNSATKLSGTTSNFTVPLQIPQGEQYDRITVLQANIPVSYYLIQAGYNTFILKEGTQSVTITIPPGNYNVNSFASMVAGGTGLLTTNSPNGYTYTMTYPTSFTQNNTGLYTYSVNSSAMTISIITSTYPVFEQLGFPSNSTNMFVAGSGVSTLISSNVLKFINEDTLFIHADLCDNGSDDILQEIYNNNNSALSNISFLSTDPLSYSKKLTTNKAQTISISLTDENNLPINLNGLNMVVTIMLYKDPKFYQQFEAYVRYLLHAGDDEPDSI